MQFSARANVVARRSYNRPLNDEGTIFETWEQTITRVIGHQRWLWERAKGAALDFADIAELNELKQLMLARKVCPSGRTLWLGGTDTAKLRESSMFNCSGQRVNTVHDVVDGMWLLLQGCGVGFEPVVGTLNGFSQPIPKIEIIRSKMTIEDYREGRRGHEENRETVVDGVWTIMVGDSAEAWAKAAGKLLAQKAHVRKLVLDFSQIRAAGIRLKGYGWISSGDATISIAFKAIAEILNRRAGKLLTRIDILDIMNWLGTTLSSRRSAEIALVPYGDPEWEAFAMAKMNHYENGNSQRAQSNNTLVFYTKPTKTELRGIFAMMQEAGGSEPGFFNGSAALKRAPWFKTTNPCAEVLLGDKSFCNLFETNLAAFNNDWSGLLRAHYLAGRANYRQTVVNLRDGILQSTWHELNEFLRLCGTGVTGVVGWEYEAVDEKWRLLRDTAKGGANKMADDLGLPRPKAVTTCKPSGTMSKIMDAPGEGIHKPMGRFIFNNINFSKHDPLVGILQNAGYRSFENPYDATSILVTLPVKNDGVQFTKKSVVREGREVVIEVNDESAIEQLERYKRLILNYVDYNASITVSYSPDEIPAIVDWIDENWDHYVGVSFLYRNDPTKDAKDLGYPYLPQEVVTEEEYEAYVANLKPFSLTSDGLEADLEEGCSTGACPIR